MIAYLDCFAGASGDMILGALVDAGADLGVVESQLSGLDVAFEITFSTVQRCGLRACRVDVRDAPAGASVMRTYAEALALLEGAALEPAVASRAAAVFDRLARAEARVHGVAPAEVHFHELDGADTVVDVVGAAAAFAAMGVEEVVSSPVATGSGMIPSRHGPLPVPGPAVLELLGGAVLYGRALEAELITPTGAAILAEYASSFGKMPPMTVGAVGYGAGSRELEIPNVLRVVVGKPGPPAPEGVEDVLVEATIDDMNPELYPFVLERLSAAGAVDGWVVPAIGKGGRPAQIVSVLAPPHAEEAVRATLVAETSTLGVRVSHVRRWMLPRRWVEVRVGGIPVRVKVAQAAGAAGLEGEPVNVAPEYADCAEAARALGRPLKEVYREALTAAAALL